MQGVYYIFTIVGIDEHGYESEPQNFTVAYSDGKIKRTNADGSIVRKKKQISLSLKMLIS